MNENMILNLGGSGGASLNFRVVGNPQPEAPSENTIWVNTDVPIGAWYFDATQPENLNEGDVWFSTGTSSPVEFNALKKNGIQVYPLKAQQYVGGALVNKDAQIYKGNEWNDFAHFLFREGLGLVVQPSHGATSSLVTVTDDAITIKGDGSANNVNYYWVVDLTKYSSITMDVTAIKKTNYCIVNVCDTDYRGLVGYCAFLVDGTRRRYVIDVSMVNTTKAIVFPCQYSDHFIIHNLFLS